ncbi:MAG: amino acid ABC transporter ATP-binding protein [Synergistaceae bacterium]|nr:amino acid ABC transporter ATP-binding protein [Synergistaceae bacterium]
MLTLSNVYKKFGDNEILKGIDLEIKKGEVVVVIGPSGSGKTTLLRCVNFLVRADRGALTLNGERVDLPSASKMEILKVRRRTAFVFQNYNLFYNKTVLQNVTLGLVCGRKMPGPDAERVARDALSRVGLSDKFHVYPKTLSGGQQQRVGIARAIALSPDVIIFDEPTSALDPELVGEVLNIMRMLAADGTTMLIATHEISFAKDVASKVLFIDRGVVIEEGTPNEVLTLPKEERTKQFLRRILPDYSI